MESVHSKLKKLEGEVESLRESKEFASALIDNSPNPILVINPDASIRYANRALEELTGLATNEIVGMQPPYLWWTEETLEKTRRDLKNAMRNGAFRLEELFKRKDGSRFWVEITSTPVKRDGRMRYYLANWVDITERKRAEEALRESEELYRTLVDTSPDGLGMFDLRGNILKANRQVAQLLGYDDPKELLGKKLVEFIAPEYLGQMADRMDRLRSSGGGETVEYTLMKKDGSYMIGEVRSAAISGSGGTPKYAMAIIRDVTERKHAEEALLESEERYALATAAAHVGVWDWNLQTGDFYLDPRIKGFLGYGDEEIPNDLDVWVKYVHPDDSQAVMDAAQAHLDGKTPEYSYEHRMLHKDGSVRWISVNGRAIRDAEGKVVRMVGTDADITGRKLVEEALRQEKEFAESIVQTAPVIILLLDREGRIVSFNPYMERISGYTLEEVKGKEWFETFLPGRDREHIRGLFLAAFGGVSTRGNVNPIVTKDGQEREIEWYDNILKDADGNMVALLSIGQDITERKQAEEDLHTYQGRLKSLATQLLLVEERERRRIATELHDEIGQTLAMIKMKLGELRKEEATKEVAGRLDKVLNLCGKAIQDTRSLIFELSPPVLYELGFEAAVAWLAERYTREHGILVGFEDDGEPKPLDEDLRILLFQSVRELLNNAVRYAQASEVRIRVGRDGDDIRVEVEDDGVGFDPSGLKQKEGFGLFNIHERLSSVGGRFILSSAPQEGTRVILKASLKDRDVQS